MNNFFIPKRAMAIYAHPDDIEFSCAGTIARWVQSGTKVSYVLATSGDVGIADPGISKQEAIEIRQKETREAAKIAGAEEVIFLGEPDGMVQATLELRKKIVREIRRYKPEVVLTMDPTVVFASDRYINHPDHRATATAVLDAVFPAAGQPNLFEEIEKEDGHTAHKVRKVYVSSWENQDLFVKIDNTIDTKIMALKAHKSQMNGWDPAPMIKEWGMENAKGKEMQFAEGYRVITLVTDEDWEISQGDPLKIEAAKKQNEARSQNSS